MRRRLVIAMILLSACASPIGCGLKGAPLPPIRQTPEDDELAPRAQKPSPSPSAQPAGTRKSKPRKKRPAHSQAPAPSPRPT